MITGQAHNADVLVEALWPNRQLTKQARLLASGVAEVTGKPVNSSALTSATDCDL